MTRYPSLRSNWIYQNVWHSSYDTYKCLHYGIVVCVGSRQWLAIVICITAFSCSWTTRITRCILWHNNDCCQKGILLFPSFAHQQETVFLCSLKMECLLWTYLNIDKNVFGYLHTSSPLSTLGISCNDSVLYKCLMFNFCQFYI